LPNAIATPAKMWTWEDYPNVYHRLKNSV
jgi:hypothetical protein